MRLNNSVLISASYTITSALSIRCAAFTVSSPASPGPAPASHTFPLLSFNTPASIFILSFPSSSALPESHLPVVLLTDQLRSHPPNTLLYLHCSTGLSVSVRFLSPAHGRHMEKCSRRRSPG